MFKRSNVMNGYDTFGLHEDAAVLDIIFPPTDRGKQTRSQVTPKIVTLFSALHNAVEHFAG